MGYGSRDTPFQRLHCGYLGRVEHWTHVAWLVSRSALNPAVVREQAIILPECLIDPETLPHAHRWLREQPLVCVSGATWRRLAATGVPVFRVAFDASSDRVLDLESTGGSAGPRSVAVALDALQDSMAVACKGRPLLDVQGDPSLIDRTLRMASDGTLDESSVLNALDVRRIIEDGYGYRGALEGSFNDIEGLAREFETLDVLFGQIFERATTMLAAAEGLSSALVHADPEADAVSVPIYGTARRIVVPALRVPQTKATATDGPSKRDLELPTEWRWTVERVDPWSPQLPEPVA
ncbi:MAG: hypothetical protein JRI55_37245 [Deltaproteobacteria bacterium]|nr:hypothetical protein [Deltaproteobacteria bacterium]